MVDVGIKPLPPKDALDYFRAKGLALPDDRFDYRDVWRGQHAASFVVAKAMDDDILTLIRAELDKALAEGRTLAQFQADLAPRLQAAGWWGKSTMADPLTGELREVRLGSMHRLRTIFDTNMRTAQAAGRWTRIQRRKKRFPYLRYVQLDRPNKRPAHTRFDGLVRPVDDPIWERIYPPNGWFCACSAEPVTQGQIDRGEYQISPPFDLDEIPLPNDRHGIDEPIPNGVTPGFDVNPGMIRHRMDQAFAPTRLDTRTELALLAADLQERMRREGFERAVVIQPGREVHDRYRGVSHAVQIGKADRGSDIIHSHPTDPTLSEADLTVLFGNSYRSIFGVTPEGEIFGAIARDQGALAWQAAHRDFLNEFFLPGNVWEMRDMAEWERMTVYGHARMLWLERAGVLDYLQPVSPRLNNLFDRYAPLLDVLRRAQGAGRNR
ncbi:phage head morphogenesis protein [Paracoccus jiaweipingae]|uniref:phage head morphogenesis protein n=1 Tax=Paracoccus sp. p2-l61 TaxID=3366950 RepID=UPI0037AE230E